MVKIKDVFIKKITKPLKFSFTTSLGSKTEMKSLLVKITLDSGFFGIGECPTSFVSKSEDIETMKKTITCIKNLIKDKPIEDYEVLTMSFREKFSDRPLTVSGVEVALFRAYITNHGIDEHNYWGAKLNRLETDITIPFSSNLNHIKTWLNYVVDEGFKIFKVKVSGNVEQDERLISFIIEVLKNSVDGYTIRLDGNQGFAEKTFLKFQDILEKRGYKIDCFEQPLQKDDFSGMKNIKKHSTIPIILDETIFNLKDLERALSDNMCDGINIKIAKSGIMESKRMIELAKKNNLKLMVGCMTETMVGLSAGIYMASGTGEFDYIDLDSVYYITHRKHYENIEVGSSFFNIKTS